MRDAQEERRVLHELQRKQATEAAVEVAAVEVAAEQIRRVDTLRIDPYRRS